MDTLCFHSVHDVISYIMDLACYLVGARLVGIKNDWVDADDATNAEKKKLDTFSYKTKLRNVFT